MVDRILASKFNWSLFVAILAVSIIGVITINSANHGRTELFFRDLYIKQIYWVLFGLVAMLIALVIDYRELRRHAYAIYSITVLALIYVAVNGDTASGAKRWIHIGSLSLQVSEFAKIALILALAKYFESGKIQGQYFFKNLWIPTLLTGVIVMLIAIQPDLSSFYHRHRNRRSVSDKIIRYRYFFNSFTLVFFKRLPKAASNDLVQS